MVAAGYSRDFAFISDCLVVLSPEHFKLLRKKFSTREAFVHALHHACNAKVLMLILTLVPGSLSWA